MKGPAMFKNREIRIKMSKTPKHNDNVPTMEERIGEASADIVNDVAKDILKRAAIAVGAIVVVIKVVDILGEIAVKKTKSADN
jgi:hypothetical protein